MKIGAEDRKKVIAMSVLLAVAAAVGLYNLRGPFGSGASAVRPSAPVAASQAKKTASAGIQDPSRDPRLRLDILEASRNVKYQPGRDIFHMQAIPVPTPIAQVRAAATPPPTPTPVPTPPPIPLKYYGYASKPGEPKKVFLSDDKGIRVFVVGQGEIVDRRYRLIQIQANLVEMEDVLTNNRQPIYLTSNQPPRR